jgi:hypothetical protein
MLRIRKGIDFGHGVQVIYDNGAGELKIMKDATEQVGLSSAETIAAGAQASNITDASEAHDVTGVDGTGDNAASKADTDAALDALGAKLNAVIAALEAFGITASE